MQVLCLLLALAAVLVPLELKYPYYFLQDDNRDFMLPWLVHTCLSLLGGEVPLYNFHQYSGLPSLGSASGALYPPGYVAALFSGALFGHHFATVDLMVVFHLVIGALGWLAFFRILNLGPSAAIYGALACALNSFLVYAGSSWMCVSALGAWFPWMLYFGLSLLRRSTLANWLGLLAVRLLLFYHGYIQYFLYAAVLELLVVAGILLASPDHRPEGSRRRPLLLYLSSWVYVALLSAPLLLPMWRQTQVSAFRQTKVPFTEFVTYSARPLTWAAGLLNPFSQVVPVDLAAAIPYLSHVGCLSVILIVIGPMVFLDAPPARKRLALLWVLLAGAVLTLATGGFAAELHQLPIYNRMRWPFKYLVFVKFFLAVLSALVLDQALRKWIAAPSRRVVGCLSVILLAGNYLLLYAGTTPKPFRTHLEPIPFDEPLKEALGGGKIFTIGFPWGYRLPTQALGFDYATLWGLYHFAGYEPLVPETNADLALDLQYLSSFHGQPSQVPWAHLRRWGVRWYVTPSDAPESLSRWGLIPRFGDTARRIFEDPKANGLVFWEDGRTDPVTYDITTNRMQLRSSAKEAGRLCVNFLWHPLFEMRMDGRPGPLSANVYGQMLLEVPPGEHSIEIRFYDPEFSAGLKIAAAVLAALAAHTVLWTRKS